MVPYFFLQNLCTVLPILRVALHKRPTVHITNVRLSIGSQQVETANVLTKLLHNSITDIFFIRSQNHRITHLFPLFVS